MKMNISRKFLLESSLPSLSEIDVERSKNNRPTVLIIPKCGDIFLMFLSKEYNNWQFPQVGILNKENLKDACEREIIEEVGKRFWDRTNGTIDYKGSFNV